jgi:hypothetical protein
MPRTVSTPTLCPATRGKKRFFAQRPLPSMMTAIWRGISSTSGITLVELENMLNYSSILNINKRIKGKLNSH